MAGDSKLFYPTFIKEKLMLAVNYVFIEIYLITGLSYLYQKHDHRNWSIDVRETGIERYARQKLQTLDRAKNKNAALAIFLVQIDVGIKQRPSSYGIRQP